MELDPAQLAHYRRDGYLRLPGLIAPERLARWEARFEDYREVEGTAFAHDVQLVFPRVSARASLAFKRVQLGPELDDELFVLTLPERSAVGDGSAAGSRERGAL